MTLNNTDINSSLDTSTPSILNVFISPLCDTKYQSDEESGLISDRTQEIYEFILCTLITGTIFVAGIGANILNILVYWRLGLQESLTVSLFSLSVSDLVFLILSLWVAICQAPLLRHHSNTGLFLYELIPVSGATHKIAFNSISTWITVLVTIERCYSIINPLRIRQTFTPRKTAAVILVFGVFFPCVNIPTYLSFDIGSYTLPGTNITRMSVFLAEANKKFLRIALPSNVFVRYVSLFVITVSTIWLLCVLHKQKQGRYFSCWPHKRIWPSEVTTGYNLSHETSQDLTPSACSATGRNVAQQTHKQRHQGRSKVLSVYHMSTIIGQNQVGASPAVFERSFVNKTEIRRQRLGKMVALVSGITLVEMLPTSIFAILLLAEPEFRLCGRYANFFTILRCVTNVVGAVKASCNILVYNYMSSQFRATLKRIFGHYNTLGNTTRIHRENLRRLQARPATCFH